MFGFIFEYFLIGCAVLLLLAIISSKTSNKLGVPLLLTFLFIGMIAGSDGIGGIYFENAKLAQHLGIIALLFILFSGGLETDRENISPVFYKGLSLSTLGVLCTALLIGFLSWKILGMPMMESFLLGSIVSSTDAAAVFSVLRSKNIGIKPSLRTLLEFESGSNDPSAVFLVIFFITFLQQSASNPILNSILHFISQMGIGLILGYIFGKVAVWFINRIRLDQDALYPIVTTAFVILVYGVTTILNGSGFIAAYILGIILGNSKLIRKRNIKKFHDTAAWFMQIIMFITLGLLVFPSQLPSIANKGIIISIFLMLIARPLSVFISLSFSKIPIKEKIFISWVGLRGATPIILATFPFVAGIPNANELFNITFFIVISSVLFQGTTIPLAAKTLGISVPFINREHIPIEIDEHENINNELFEVQVPDHSPIINKKILELSLPQNTLVVLINKGDSKYITPKGNTVVEIHDRLLILSEKGNKEVIQKMIKKL